MDSCGVGAGERSLPEALSVTAEMNTATRNFRLSCRDMSCSHQAQFAGPRRGRCYEINGGAHKRHHPSKGEHMSSTFGPGAGEAACVHTAGVTCRRARRPSLQRAGKRALISQRPSHLQFRETGSEKRETVCGHCRRAGAPVATACRKKGADLSAPFALAVS